MPNVPIPRAIVSETGGNFLAINAQGAAKVTGDVRITDPIVIGNVTVSVDVTGDTTATQNPGDIYNTRQQGVVGVQIVGGSGGGTYGVSGDVTTLPKSGERWPVSGQTGGGSGDVAIVDGVTRSLKATVRDFVDADALSVVHTPSGDRTYWNESIDLNDGTPASGVTVHTPASGKKFYIDTLVLATGTSGEVQFYSDTTKISGSMPLAVNGGIAIDHGSFDERSKFRGRAVNNPFNIKLSRTMQVGGYVTGYDQ